MTVAGRTHHPEWRAEECLPCGACRQACPAWVHIEEQQERESLRGMVARAYPFPAPRERRAVPPCTATCPLRQDVPGYLAAIARGDTDAARGIILETNPLPGVLSILCNASCMRVCVRASIGACPDVRGLKAVPFGADAVEGRGWRGASRPRSGRERAFVVGSGPAGLAAAEAIARTGIDVAIIERDAEPGGMLRSAIPQFILPREVLDADIRRILEGGEKGRGRIAIETGEAVEAGSGIERLLEAGRVGRRALVIATGAPCCRMPAWASGPVPEGVKDVVGFMQDIVAGRSVRSKGPVIVEGEGPAAVAAARAAARSGSREVILVISRPRELAAADAGVLAQAQSEGVEIAWATAVVGVRGDKRLEAVLVAKCSFEPAGRGRVVAVPGKSRKAVKAALLVFAGARDPETGFASRIDGVQAGMLGTLARDGAMLATTRPGIFAAGDIASGAKTLVEAVASGLRAGGAAARWLEGERCSEERP